MMERDECNSGYSVEELSIKRTELLEFVSEYGPPEALPELPSLAKIIPEADRWPVNWDAYARRCLHGDILRRWIGEPDSLEQLIRDSQEYQAFHLKYHTEFYRRHKFRPCNGALFFQFKDCWPALTAAVVDYYGRPKRAYYTLRHAFNPIQVLMEWPPLAGEAPGSAFRKALFVVNDYHHPYPALQVKWQVRDASGTPSWSGKSPAASPPTRSPRSPAPSRPPPPPATVSPSNCPRLPAPCPTTSTASPSRVPFPSLHGVAGCPPPTPHPIVQKRSDGPRHGPHDLPVLSNLLADKGHHIATIAKPYDAGIRVPTMKR